MNIAPLKLESVDIIGFFPETLDLLIIGCTTGVLKDDLAKLDSVINTMKNQISDIFKKCAVTPIIVYTKNAAISPSDTKYSRDQRIVILDQYSIDKLLEMLFTNRDIRQVLYFIKEEQWKYEDNISGYPY